MRPRGIGIDFISVFGLPPVQFVALAAELGCQHISIALTPMPGNPLGYPLWSLRDDAGLRKDLVAVLRDHGISISLGEGFLLRPGTDIREAAGDMVLMRELGVPCINIVPIDPDWSRSIEQLSLFAEMAAAHGLAATLEYMPGMRIGDLATAAAAVNEVGNQSLRLLIDAMHLFRSGGGAADVAALAPEMIGYVQLCDVPVISKYAAYGDEARHYRLPPGEGELPLRDFIAALPRDLMVGLEVPMLGEALAGVGPYERMSRCVQAARALLAEEG
jgi:sugar phosphate isomerase/epimerase